MKKRELILLVIVGYGLAPFGSIISAIWPVTGNIILFGSLGIVLWLALRAIIQRNGWTEVR